MIWHSTPDDSHRPHLGWRRSQRSFRLRHSSQARLGLCCGLDCGDFSRLWADWDIVTGKIHRTNVVQISDSCENNDVESFSEA